MQILYTKEEHQLSSLELQKNYSLLREKLNVLKKRSRWIGKNGGDFKNHVMKKARIRTFV